ncbi:glycosyl transferase family 2, partial [Bacillus sp. S34]|nr:glycosyl transferase family 2 [Bacillus sp. S34]
DRFMHEKFMGVFLEVSDDRTLTNLTLKEGYRTVYQYTSLVYTDAPLQVKKLFKQQLRWARGSQYNTLRMLPWMLGHAPV